jgi:hypothetical protein
MKNLILSLVLAMAFTNSAAQSLRPNYHYTPPNNWVKDPKGLVYLDGEYQLFYQ